jgi:hypothetical protein
MSRCNGRLRCLQGFCWLFYCKFSGFWLTCSSRHSSFERFLPKCFSKSHQSHTPPSRWAYKLFSPQAVFKVFQKPMDRFPSCWSQSQSNSQSWWWSLMRLHWNPPPHPLANARFLQWPLTLRIFLEPWCKGSWDLSVSVLMLLFLI